LISTGSRSNTTAKIDLQQRLTVANTSVTVHGMG
jgi:hypothetical protein